MLAKLISEEEQENAQNSSKPETTGVVSMPTMRKQAASVSEENETVLVPNVRSDSESTLGIQASKGGRKGVDQMNKPAHGTLVVKLVRLKSYCEEKCQSIAGTPIRGELTPEDCVDQGRMRAYMDIEIRLNRLIASESGTKPKGR